MQPALQTVAPMPCPVPSAHTSRNQDRQRLSLPLATCTSPACCFCIHKDTPGQHANAQADLTSTCLLPTMPNPLRKPATLLHRPQAFSQPRTACLCRVAVITHAVSAPSSLQHSIANCSTIAPACVPATSGHAPSAAARHLVCKQ